MKSVLILGASGIMGQRLVHLARRLIPGTRVVQASRHGPEEPSSDYRRVDIHNRQSLRRGLAGMSAVINSVGPFDYDPSPLLACCLEEGCHYVDIAETAEFVGAVEQAARGGGPAVVSGCSTVPALIAVLVQNWVGREDVRRFRILLSLGSSNAISPAKMYSLLRPLGSPAPGGVRYFDRLAAKTSPGPVRRLYGRYPTPFDKDGIRMGERLVPMTFHVGLDRAVYCYFLWLAASILPALSGKRLMQACRLARPFIPVVHRLGTPLGILSVEACAHDGRVVDEIEIRAQREGLNIPALPCIWAVRHFLEQAPSLPSGAVRLDQLFTPAQVTTWLQEEDYQVRGIRRDSIVVSLAGG